MVSRRSMFVHLKKPDLLNNFVSNSTQDTIDIKKVSCDGLFQVNDSLWSKSYEIGDINYSIFDKKEQLRVLAKYSMSLSSFDVPFKITIFNKNRNVKEMNEKVLYRMKENEYDAFREEYNEVIKSSLFEGNQKIEQRKILTMSYTRRSYQEAKHYGNSIDQAVMKEFASVGSYTRPLSGKERLRILHDFYRVGRESQFDLNIEECILSGRDWKNDVAPFYIDFGDKQSFKMNGKFCKALYIDPNSYPTDLDDEVLHELSGFNMPGMVSVDFIPIRDDYTRMALEAKQAGVQREISRQQRARNRDHDYLSGLSYEIVSKKEALEEMRDDIKENNQKLFWVGITIILVADSKEQLEGGVDYIKQIAEKRSMRINTYFDKQREGLATALPVGGRYVCEMRGLFSRVCASFRPFNVMEYQDMTTDKGVPFYYGKNKISKEGIYGNRKNLLNSSGFVVGVPGSGKSFNGAKMEIGSVFLNTNDDILILDPTLEYMEVIDAWNGDFVNIETNTQNHINPLHISLEIFDDNTILDQTIREKYILMRGICAQSMDGEFCNKHSSVIDRAVRRLFYSISDLPKEKRYIPIMGDFVKALKEENQENRKEFVDDVEISLDVFINGSLNIFNHENNVDSNNRVVAYGIRDMDEELSKVAMLVILENIKKRVMENFKRGKATWLYIDEFHMMLDSKYTRNFVVKFWKLVRKLGCIPTALTQNVSPLLDFPDVATLLANSEFNIFLRQGIKDAKKIVEFFDNIPESQVEELASADKGIGLIRFSNSIIPFDNQMDKKNPLYNLYNTNLHEKAAMQKAEKQRTRKKILLTS